VIDRHTKCISGPGIGYIKSAQRYITVSDIASDIGTKSGVINSCHDFRHFSVDISIIPSVIVRV
jgi:hypothetical protein